LLLIIKKFISYRVPRKKYYLYFKIIKILLKIELKGILLPDILYKNTYSMVNKRVIKNIETESKLHYCLSYRKLCNSI